MFLIGKTLKGKNKIREAGTNEWVVIKDPQRVQFAEGLWIMIEPANGKSEKSRWVRFDAPDKDFIW